MNAVGYFRILKGNENREQIIADTCEDKGHTLLQTIADEDGAKLTATISEAKKHGLLVCYSLTQDILAGSLGDNYATLMNFVGAKPVFIISIEDGIDTSSAEGKSQLVKLYWSPIHTEFTTQQVKRVSNT